jgi:hypothetical protein
VKLPPLPPCIHTEITQHETIEAHFAQVASIWSEPEAVEVGRGVRKTRFNQGFNAPSLSVPRSEDVNDNKLPGIGLKLRIRIHDDAR